MERNCDDAEPPNGFSHMVNQRKKNASEEFDLTKYQCLIAVGKQDQGIWRSIFRCTSLLDAVYLPHDL